MIQSSSMTDAVTTTPLLKSRPGLWKLVPPARMGAELNVGKSSRLKFEDLEKKIE
jgi:hypothetical protein